MLKINGTSKFSKNNNDPKKPNVSLDKYMLSLKLDESNASNPGGWKGKTWERSWKQALK